MSETDFPKPPLPGSLFRSLRRVFLSQPSALPPNAAGLYLESPLASTFLEALHSTSYAHALLILRNAPLYHLLDNVPALIRHCEAYRQSNPTLALTLLTDTTAILGERDFTLQLDEAQHDLLALLAMERANLLRILGRFTAAEELFTSARQSLRRGWRDPLLLAQWRSLRASLDLYTSRFSEASDNLRLALGTYRRFRHQDSRKVLLQLGLTALHQDHFAVARRYFRQAGELAQREPRALLSVAHNLTISYLWEGRYDLAFQFHADTRSLYVAHGTSADLARSSWTHGEILLGRGAPHLAEPALLDAIERFTRLELPYEAAQVAVALARAFRETEQLDRIAPLFAGVLPLLESEGLAAEARAVLLLLRSVDQVELAHLAAARIFLRRRVYNPCLTFSLPS